MTNNKRKMKHLVKFSRHWKFTEVLHLSQSDIEYALHDSESYNQLVNNLFYRLVDKITDSIDRYGFPWWKELPEVNYGSIVNKIMEGEQNEGNSNTNR